MFLCFDALPLRFYSFDLYWSRDGWLSINPLFLAVLHSWDIFPSGSCLLHQQPAAAARGQVSCLCLPVCLALSLHVRLWVCGDMSALMDCIYTQGGGGWVKETTSRGKWSTDTGGGLGQLKSLLINSNSKLHSVHHQSVKYRCQHLTNTQLSHQQPCSGSRGEGTFFHCLDVTLCEPNRLLTVASQFDLCLSTASLCLQRQEAATTSQCCTSKRL